MALQREWIAPLWRLHAGRGKSSTHVLGRCSVDSSLPEEQVSNHSSWGYDSSWVADWRKTKGGHSEGIWLSGLVLPHIPKDERKMFHSKTKRCIFLEYGATTKAYRLYGVDHKSLLQSWRHLWWFERWHPEGADTYQWDGSTGTLWRLMKKMWFRRSQWFQLSQQLEDRFVSKATW